MADNLRRAGHELIVFDKSIAAVERFCAEEETPSAPSPAAIAETDGVLRTLLGTAWIVMCKA